MNNKQIEIFFQLHQGIPREGPGDSESTKNAFLKLRDLPPNPHIIDIGCGPGFQTLDLASLTDGTIIAIDNHDIYVNELKQQVLQQGLSEKITVINADMFALDFPDATFDVIWAEGSIYILGFENGLKQWKPLLNQRGYLVASELTWLKHDAPKELKEFWSVGYPAMQDIEGNLKIIQNSGYKIIDYFILAESAWWNHYHQPLEKKLQGLRKYYQNDIEALEVINMEQLEIDMYRKYSEYYSYVFYIMQK
ncbi:methyltransferase domain-containing protein [Nodularia harveyana UHCC-0300]|uniref:Methyltransferase domain-containing protein n=1 Tax=Nodularia harveyana UHCC-0300 TaxID=2974287 RepID=A0ABU5U943_9CYAN|nr:methyltransferase domain-containing protein [Nodularia harveyana]MEA5580022.1 methyltransferase domain-containing protein [Nodularia harveyana UHCC-0300]